MTASIIFKIDVLRRIHCFLTIRDSLSFEATHSASKLSANLLADRVCWERERRRLRLPPPRPRAKKYKTSRDVVAKFAKDGKLCIGTRGHPGCGLAVEPTPYKISRAFDEPSRCRECTRARFCCISQARAEIAASKLCLADRKQLHEKLRHASQKPVYNGRMFLGTWMRREDVFVLP